MVIISISLLIAFLKTFLETKPTVIIYFFFTCVSMQKVITSVMVFIQLDKTECQEMCKLSTEKYHKKESKLKVWLKTHICSPVTQQVFLTGVNAAGNQGSSFYWSCYLYENIICLFTTVFIKCISYYVVNFSNTMNIFSWKLPEQPLYRIIMPVRNTAVIQSVKYLAIHLGTARTVYILSAIASQLHIYQFIFCMQPVLSPVNKAGH